MNLNFSFYNRIRGHRMKLRKELSCSKAYLGYSINISIISENLSKVQFAILYERQKTKTKQKTEKTPEMIPGNCFRKSDGWKFVFHSPSRKKENIKKQEDKYQKKLKKKIEYLWISHRDMITSFANFHCVLLTCLIKSWISVGCSYEFSAVYVEREKSQYLLYYSNMFSAALLRIKIKKSLKDIFVCHFLFYVCLFVGANLL